jgi:hypothetical protein
MKVPLDFRRINMRPGGRGRNEPLQKRFPALDNGKQGYLDCKDWGAS